MHMLWTRRRLLAASSLMFFSALLPGAARDAKLPPITVQKVYLLSMGSGLDQYLAGRLTEEGVVTVVTDPKMADAVLTDRLGEAFERRYQELFVPPPPPPPPAQEDESDDSPRSRTELRQKTPEELREMSAAPPRNSTFGRSKGTVFLVGIPGKQVLWSMYALPHSTSPSDLNRLADKIADRLRDRLKPAKP